MQDPSRGRAALSGLLRGEGSTSLQHDATAQYCMAKACACTGLLLRGMSHPHCVPLARQQGVVLIEHHSTCLKGLLGPGPMQVCDEHHAV